jgi:hypothetical protein
MQSNTISNPASEMLQVTTTSLLQTTGKLFPPVCLSIPDMATLATKIADMKTASQLQTVAIQSIISNPSQQRVQKAENHDKNGNYLAKRFRCHL